MQDSKALNEIRRKGITKGLQNERRRQTIT